jgi:hypothetical protein
MLGIAWFSAGKKVTGKNCDTCFAYMVNTTGKAFMSEAGITEMFSYWTNEEFTFTEKIRAMVEACAPKVKKALKGKVSKKKLEYAMSYPNGAIYECPWDIRVYPQTIGAFLIAILEALVAAPIIKL